MSIQISHVSTWIFWVYCGRMPACHKVFFFCWYLLRPESSGLINFKNPGTCRESSESTYGFVLSVRCQRQNAFASKNCLIILVRKMQDIIIWIRILQALREVPSVVLLRFLLRVWQVKTYLEIFPVKQQRQRKVHILKYLQKKVKNTLTVIQMLRRTCCRCLTPALGIRQRFWS